jgi:hypothetical protein
LIEDINDKEFKTFSDKYASKCPQYNYCVFSGFPEEPKSCLSCWNLDDHTQETIKQLKCVHPIRQMKKKAYLESKQKGQKVLA